MTTTQVIERLHDVLPGLAGVVEFTVVSDSTVALDFDDGTRAILAVAVQ